MGWFGALKLSLDLPVNPFPAHFFIFSPSPPALSLSLFAFFLSLHNFPNENLSSYHSYLVLFVINLFSWNKLLPRIVCPLKFLFFFFFNRAETNFRQQRLPKILIYEIKLSFCGLFQVLLFLFQVIFYFILIINFIYY